MPGANGASGKWQPQLDQVHAQVPPWSDARLSRKRGGSDDCFLKKYIIILGFSIEEAKIQKSSSQRGLQ